MAVFNYSFAQQNFWTLSPSIWNMTNTPPSASVLTNGTTSQYINSNGAYDQNGNLIFYVQDDVVLSSNGSYVGHLLPYYVQGVAVDPDGFGSQNQNNFESIGAEISIVPVPNYCNQYYIIYTMANGISPSRYLLYMKIDCSNTTPILSSPSASSIPFRPINALQTLPSTLQNNSGIAISKKIAGGNRYLFAGGQTSIERFTISSTGISSQVTISNASDEPTLFSGTYSSSDELELSPDQQWLAWGNTSAGKLNLIKLNASYTKIAGASKTEPIVDIKGLEFNANSNRLYICNSSGLRYYDFLTSSPNQPLGGILTNITNTFLERAKNGKIYGVNNAGKLQEIDEANLTLGTEITTSSIFSDGTNHGLANASCYRLNDQIDGENYDNFNGVESPIVAYTLNNAPIATDCNTPVQVFNCTGYDMSLQNLSTNSTQYKVDLYQASSSCGTYTLVHSTGVLNTFPTDLRNLPGGASGSILTTSSGFFKLIITGYNICSASSFLESYIHVTSSPAGASSAFKTNALTKAGQSITINGCNVPSNTQFTYHDGAQNCGGTGGYKFQMEHTSVATPNQVGRLSTVFDLTSVTGGTGSSTFTVRVNVDRWNGSIWESMDTDPSGELLNGVTTLPLVSLLGYDASNPWYEAFNDVTLTPNGSIYRVTITVINECGSISTSQIIQLNTILLRSAPGENVLTGKDVSLRHRFKFSPNPTEGGVGVVIPANVNDKITIIIYDAFSNRLKTITENHNAVQGNNEFTADISDLTPGHYTGMIKINDQIYTEKIIKR